MNETEIQKAVFDHLRTRGAAGVFAFHPKNGGAHQAHRTQRRVNGRLGIVAGVPDVIAIHKGRVYGLELKREGAKPPSEEQLEAQAKMNEAGAFTATAVGLDRALACLEAWGLLRGAAA